MEHFAGYLILALVAYEYIPAVGIVYNIFNLAFRRCRVNRHWDCAVGIACKVGEKDFGAVCRENGNGLLRFKTECFESRCHCVDAFVYFSPGQ